jgi:hypothetical protein
MIWTATDGLQASRLAWVMLLSAARTWQLVRPKLFVRPKLSKTAAYECFNAGASKSQRIMHSCSL